MRASSIVAPADGAVAVERSARAGGGANAAGLVVRAISRLTGYRIASGATETFLTRVAALDLPASVSESLVSVRSVMQLLDKELVTIVFKMFPMRMRITLQRVR